VKRRRVVITGVGVVAPNGIGKDAFWQNLIAGKSAVDWITAFDPAPYPSRIAAEVKVFNPQKFMSPKRARQLWRFSQFAVASAVMAVEDASIKIAETVATETSVCFGTSINGMGTAEQSHATFLEKGPDQVRPHILLECPPHASASHVAIELGITGPTLTISSNCCTGLDVIDAGYKQIVSGRSDVAIVGGCEAPIFPFSFATFSAVRLLSTRNDNPKKASRPYDMLRDGLVLGEGGGAVVLEEMEFARGRGAPIYAEVAGYASATEQTDMRKTDTTGETLAAAIRRALRNAGIHESEIDYVNAHGSSVPDYDICDTNAFKTVFGHKVFNIPISSIKSMLGQAISVSGMFQVISSCLAIRDSIIPPTINQEVPDPLCDLDYVPNKARTCRVNQVLMNSHGIGGSLSTLILRRAE
jgi:3-oxoacyl-[acyl-carrier-protein] synthase II